MNTRVTFQIKHVSGKVVDSISLPSMDALWSEKEFTEKHGKESQSRRGTFRLWRDDADDRLIVLSMINKIPDVDVSKSCFQFVVQVQKPSARVIEPTITYYDSNTCHAIPEAHFAMASKTPDEVAGKTKRASGGKSKSTNRNTPSGARARHKGASTNAKKPKSAATLSVTTPAPVISARGGSGSAFAPCASGATKAKPKAKSKKKNSVGATGQAPKPRSRTTRRIRKQNGGAASPVGTGLAAPCTRRDGTHAAHHKDSDGMISSTMITGNTFPHGDSSVPHDGCLPTMPVSSASGEQHMTEEQWTCPPPELPAGPVEDNDTSLIQESTQGNLVQVEIHADETVASGFGSAKDHPILRHGQHGGDDAADAEADEAEMVGLVKDNSLSHDDGVNSGNNMFSPVWSEESFSRSSSAASATGSVMSTTDMLGVSLDPNYTVDATPGPVFRMLEDARLPPAPPSPPPPLSFGRRDVAAPATSGRLSQPAARMLAANTPIQAIEAGDGDTTGSSYRRSSLDMALYDTDSCGSWMDDDDGIQQGAVEGEDSPHFVSVVHGTPMACSLAAKLSPSRLH
eukprot:COSAG02_NODE_4933_length_4818_cov_2.172706_1_plen_570_part_00